MGLSTLICYPWAYSITLTQLYPPCLAQTLGFWVTCGVKMMQLWHGWGWQSPKTASQIHIRHAKKYLSTLICYPLAYGSSLTQFYPPYLAQFFGFWITCGVNIMWLCHGWGWQPPQTASHIHIKHVQSVWAHWYAVHMHTISALQSYTHPTSWLRFWDSGSLVESKWCDYVMVEADSHLKLLPTSILDIYKVIEHIDMLSMGIQYHPYTVTPTLLGSDFGVLGHLWVKMMWLCHARGWQPSKTASHIHIRHIQSVWAHWYAVHCIQ